MITINRNNPTPGEITSSLTNASDSAGLHFDGAAGNIDIASPPDLGTKFSFEFILQADEWKTTGSQHFLCDFGNGGRLIFGTLNDPAITGELGVYSVGGWNAFTGNPKVLDDLKVHHLVVTIDGTAAVLYDNGNQVGTATITSPNIDSCSDAAIGSLYSSASTHNFSGTFYRARFWNKTLSQAEVTATYENATVPFADQYGSQTIVIPGDFDGNLDGWNASGGGSNTWNSQTNLSNNMVLAANATGQRCRTSTTLTDNKRYRVTYTATSTSGAPNFAYYDGGYSSFTPTNTGGSSTITDGTNTLEFIFPIAATLGYFYIHATTASDAVTLDDVSVVEIGCVSDYDLAFAQPEISTIIQDRAGAADGTSSASGVTQVTPIEAVNTNKLNVGGTTPRVGIGLAAGSTPSQHLHIDNGTKPNILLTRTAGVADTTTEMGSVFFGNNDTSKYLCSINGVQDGVKASGKLTFATQPDGGSRTTRMTIDSAGAVTTASDCAASPGSGNVAPLILGGGTDGNKRLLIGYNTTANQGFIQAVNHTVAYSDLVLQPAGGNVGVGISPATRLDVAGGTNSDHATFSGQAGRGLLISTENTLNNDDGAVLDAQTSTGKLIFKTVGAERMRIDSGGKITIGNNIPMWSGSYGGALVLKGNNATAARHAQLAIVDSSGAIVKDGLIVDTNGAVTMPSTPAFLVKPTSNQTNIASGSSVTVVLGTEIFDQGANFASNIFTAPVAGRYQFNCNVRIDDIDSSTAFYQLLLITSNRTHTLLTTNVQALDTNASYWQFNGSILTDMDASDTANLAVNISSGGHTTSDIDAESSFSGFLAC